MPNKQLIPQELDGESLEKTQKSATKPVLLFIHGFRGNHLGLEDVVKKFKQAGYRCYSPDIPPASNTLDEEIPELTDFSSDGYADWLKKYIEDKHLKSPVLIGHSMGSIISAATAEKYPELISNKIFFISPICVAPPRFIRHAVPLVRYTPAKVVDVVTTNYLLVRRKSYKNILQTVHACSEKFTSYEDEEKAAIFSISYAISAFNFEKDCHFIAGESDRLNSKRQVRKIAKQFNGTTDFLPKTGHLVNFENPDLLFETIKKYL